jgi:hypothetical protein
LQASQCTRVLRERERERERSDVVVRILVTTVAGIEVFFFTVRDRERQNLATVFV